MQGKGPSLGKASLHLQILTSPGDSVLPGMCHICSPSCPALSPSSSADSHTVPSGWLATVGGGYGEDVIPGWPASRNQRIEGSSTPQHPEMHTLPQFPQPGAISMVQPWESKVWLKPLDGMWNWTPLRLLLNSYDSGVQARKSPQPLATSLPSNFPCLLELPPANLEWLPLSSLFPCSPCSGAKLQTSSSNAVALMKGTH